MSREIKFRGQHFEIEEWIFGDLINKGFDGKAFFLKGIKPTSEYPICVDMDTVGEFTGLTDKNKIEIFEGDILKNPQGNLGEVVFEDGKFTIKASRNKNTFWFMPLGKDFVKNKEIIGNIHETPEILNIIG